MADEQAKDVKAEDEGVPENKAETIDPIQYKETLAEVARLKAFHDEVLAEKKAETERRKEAEAKAAKAKAEAEGDYKELIALKEAEIKERDDKLNAYENEKKEQKVRDAAMRIAQDLAKTNPAKAALLAKELRSKLALTEDGNIKVIDEHGKLVSDKLDVLSDYAKKNYDFLCDGLQSTGGAGVVVGKPTGTQENIKLSPVERLMRANEV